LCGHSDKGERGGGEEGLGGETRELVFHIDIEWIGNFSLVVYGSYRRAVDIEFLVKWNIIFEYKDQPCGNEKAPSFGDGAFS
jgi:hypothetical protein